MKKLLLVLAILALTATSAHAYLTGNVYVSQAWEDPNAGGAVQVHDDPETYRITCYIRGATADSNKAILAIALTAFSSNATVQAEHEWKADPDGRLAGTQCILSGLRIVK